MFKFDEYCLEGEIWKPIPFYEGLYEASNLGRIRSVDGKITYSTRHGLRKWKGRILKNKTHIPNKTTGYRISLWKNKKSKDWLVARLVAMAFIGIPENFEHKLVKKRITINHKDGNRLNNKVENLEWISLKENIRHAFDTGLMSSTQKPIILIDRNQIAKEFKSMSATSRYLNRNVGYVSLCLKKGKKKAKSKDGKEYIVKMVKD